MAAKLFRFPKPKKIKRRRRKKRKKVSVIETFEEGAIYAKKARVSLREVKTRLKKRRESIYGQKSGGGLSWSGKRRR